MEKEKVISWLTDMCRSKDWFHSVGFDQFGRAVVYVKYMNAEVLRFVPDWTEDRKQVLCHFAASSPDAVNDFISKPQEHKFTPFGKHGEVLVLTKEDAELIRQTSQWGVWSIKANIWLYHEKGIFLYDTEEEAKRSALLISATHQNVRNNNVYEARPYLSSLSPTEFMQIAHEAAKQGADVGVGQMVDSEEQEQQLELSVRALTDELDRLEKICGSNILQDVFYEIQDGNNHVTNLSAKFPEVRQRLEVLYNKYGFDTIYEELDG